jgi:hypothetical protein
MPEKKRLRTHVHVKNPKTDLYEVFGPEDDLPAWAEKEIDPGAFGDPEDLIPQPGSSQPSDDIPEDERPEAQTAEAKKADAGKGPKSE